MGWIKSIFGASEQKKSETASTLVFAGGDVKWSPRDYASFAKEGYSKNVVAYQAINRVAEAVASIAWEAWRGDELVDGSDITKLLENPNPMQSGAEFFTDYIGYLMISGNGYVEAVSAGGAPKELYALRSDRMSIKPSGDGIPAAYIYTVNSQKTVFDVDPISLASPIMHTKLFNPIDDWYGMAPIEAGSFAIDQHNEAMKWIHALLQNSARPSGALVTKSEVTLADDAFHRLKTQIEDQYSGSSNAGRPMLLEGGLDWKAMGLSPSDMSIIETKYSAARDVSLAFGVPPQLIGIPGDNTYSNYKEARLAFWEDTVLPLVAHIAGDLSGWLGPHFGDVKLKPDLDKIPAIADKRKALWEMADVSTDLTINERREIKGFEPIDGGDVVLVNASQVPLGDTSFDFSTDMKTVSRLAGYDTKAD